MLVFRRLPPVALRAPCALTIGNFDGVHRGHQALMAHLLARANRLAIVSCVLTFEPHPREYFATLGRGQAPERIASQRDKLQAIQDNGIDRVCIAHFNAGLASLPAQAFIEDVLVKGLQVRYLLIGDDFRFGAARRGDFAMLVEAGDRLGFEVERMPTVTDQGERVSSSAVRRALGAGDFVKAQALLGHPYRISGHVIHGARLGRTLGFPTLNLRIPFARPAVAGIFAVWVHGLGDAPVAGVASLGTRPAVAGDGRMLLEVHLFDFDQTVYGKVVQVEFVNKLRDERNFDSLDRLREQIGKDAAQAWQQLGVGSK